MSLLIGLHIFTVETIKIFSRYKNDDIFHIIDKIKENWIEGGGDKVSVHFAVTLWTAEELVFA